MKRTVFTLAGLWILSGVLSAAELTHSYRFDGLSGELANDTPIINQVTGLADTTFYTLGTGTGSVTDGVLRLNGTNSTNGAYLLLPEDVIGTKTSITVDAVVTPHSKLNYSRLFDFGDSNNATRFFTALYGENGSNTYTQFEGAGSAAPQANLTPDSTYRLTVTETGNVLRYYINGELAGLGTLSQDLSTRAGTMNYVGKSHWGGDSYADASLSSFDVYDGALGAAAIRTNYHASNPIDLASAAKIDTSVSKSIGYFNAANGQLYDISENHQYNGTPYNIVASAVESGNISRLLNHSGQSFQDGWNADGTQYENRYMEISAKAGVSNPLMDIGGSLTLAARINVNSFTSVISGTENFNYLIRSGQSNGATISYVLGTTANAAEGAKGDEGGYLEFRLTPDGETTSIVLTSQYQMKANTWYDVSGVFDAEKQTATIRILDSESGALLSVEELDVTFSKLNTLSGSNRNFMLMETENNRGGTFVELMDYAGVWNYALTSDELGAFAVSYVPEPASWILLLSALGVVFCRLRKFY